LSSLIFVCAALSSAISPAEAQFMAPFGGPGFLTAPEAASGAIGAGAGHSVDAQQQCQQNAVGRDGPRSYCQPYPAPPDPRR